MNKHPMWLSFLLVLTLVACNRSATPTRPSQQSQQSEQKPQAAAKTAPQRIKSPQIIALAKALNPITLQVTFETPLPPEDLVLENARANIAFSSGLSIRNVPHLKTGSKSTYLIPTTVQKPGNRYTLTYKGNTTATFDANPTKISIDKVRQVSFDTFEIESRLSERVTDYQNIIQDTARKRGGFSFTLDDNSRYHGKSYQIVPSLREAQLFVIPKGGNTVITATYVPFTQATDGRQAPKFRMPEGVIFNPGTVYTITSDWASIDHNRFYAAKIKPLEIIAVKQVSPTTLEVVLAKDPKDEVFAARSIVLAASDGHRVTAAYVANSRKGASGTFQLQPGSSLSAGTVYFVSTMGEWAKVKHVKVRMKK